MDTITPSLNSEDVNTNDTQDSTSEAVSEVLTADTGSFNLYGFTSFTELASALVGTRMDVLSLVNVEDAPSLTPFMYIAPNSFKVRYWIKISAEELATGQGQDVMKRINDTCKALATVENGTLTGTQASDEIVAWYSDSKYKALVPSAALSSDLLSMSLV